MPEDFQFAPKQSPSLSACIQAALPSGRSLLLMFSLAVLLVFVVSAGAILLIAPDQMLLLLACVPVLAVVAGGWAGWAHVNGRITKGIPDLLDAVLHEIPVLYESMERAKQQKGVRAPLWLSHALNSAMTKVVWPATREHLSERLGILRLLPVRAARRAFYRSAGYAAEAIRNEHARQQHLQSVFTPAKGTATGGLDALEQAFTSEPVSAASTDEILMPGAAETRFPSEESGGDEAGPGTPPGVADSMAFASSTTPESVRQAIDACIDDIRAAARTEARSVGRKMMLLGAAGYAAAAAVLGAVWLLGL